MNGLLFYRQKNLINFVNDINGKLHDYGIVFLLDLLYQEKNSCITEYQRTLENVFNLKQKLTQENSLSVFPIELCVSENNLLYLFKSCH